MIAARSPSGSRVVSSTRSSDATLDPKSGSTTSTRDHGPGRYGRPIVRGTALAPARAVFGVYLIAILLGGGVLALPASAAGGESVGLLDATFTATSAVCITGLFVVGTGDTWSALGLTVIAILIQLGGLGIMTFAALLLVAVRRRVSGAGEAAMAESQGVRRADVRRSVVAAFILTAVVEFVVFLALFATFLGDEVEVGSAARSAAFHSVSAFNNAGFTLWNTPVPEAPGGQVTVLILICALTIGGLGLPVWRELPGVLLRGRRLGLHARLTLITSAALLVLGTAAIIATEGFGSPALGAYSGSLDRVFGALAQSATTRTAGFDMVATDQLRPESQVVSGVLMFVGGGVGGTAGGVKVTALAVIVLAVISELRGRTIVQAFGREIAVPVLRRALAIVVSGAALVLLCSLILATTAPVTLGDATFEVVSALGTVGLSQGITPDVGATGKLLLMSLMLIGRLGPLTLAAALALRERPQTYRYPEGEVFVG